MWLAAVVGAGRSDQQGSERALRPPTCGKAAAYVRGSMVAQRLTPLLMSDECAHFGVRRSHPPRHSPTHT